MGYHLIPLAKHCALCNLIGIFLQDIFSGIAHKKSAVRRSEGFGCAVSANQYLVSLIIQVSLIYNVFYQSRAITANHVCIEIVIRAPQNYLALYIEKHCIIILIPICQATFAYTVSFTVTFWSLLQDGLFLS